MPVEVRPLRFKEAEAFWANKVPMAAEEFRGLGNRARQRAFAVAGIDRLDLVSQVHEALAKAMSGEGTLEGFKREMLPLFEAEGGISRARLETIFRTNIQSAFMAGRYAQMLEVAGLRPYWRYSAVNDSRTRPTHRALHGIVRRYDDPFWDVFYPPNGFNCRCKVTTTSTPDNPESGIPDMIEPVDPRTGQVGLPVRPWPDRGFDNNVGKDWLAGLTPEELAKDPGLISSAALCRREPCAPPLAGLAPRHIHAVSPSDLMAKGLPPEDYTRAFLKEFGLDLGESKVVTIPGGLPVVVGEGFFREKSTGAWKETWGDKGPYIRLLARTILDPFEVWLAPVDLPSGLTASVRLLRPFSLDGGKTIGGYCAFHWMGRTWSAATAFAPKANRAQRAIWKYLEELREGVLLHRETLPG